MFVGHDYSQTHPIHDIFFSRPYYCRSEASSLQKCLQVEMIKFSLTYLKNLDYFFALLQIHDLTWH